MQSKLQTHLEVMMYIGDMDHVFLSGHYDQMGFDNWFFIDFLDNMIELGNRKNIR